MMNILSMSAIDLLSPVGWWGLLGLLIPLIIHLLSKQEKNIVQFGSLRFLETIESDSARSIQLSQYLLLFLRMLLLGLICLLLVEPYINEEINSKAYWIEEDIYRSGDYNQIINVLPEDATINVFSHGVSDSVGVQYYKSIWTLIHKLNDDADSSIVYSHSLQKNFIGDPVGLSSIIDWKIVPYKSDIENIQNDWSIKADPNHIAVHNVDRNKESNVKPLSIQLIANGNDDATRQIKNVIELSRDYLIRDIKWVSSDSITEENDDDWRIIVGDKSHETYKNSIHWTPTRQLLSVASDHDHSISITGRIDRESVLDTNLPVRIATVLNNYITSIYGYDIRVLHPIVFEVNGEEENEQLIAKATLPVRNRKIPLHGYILILIVIVFGIERYLSYKSSEA